MCWDIVIFADTRLADTLVSRSIWCESWRLTWMPFNIPELCSIPVANFCQHFCYVQASQLLLCLSGSVLESYFTFGFGFSRICCCLPYADDRGVTFPLQCFSCSVGFVAVPGTRSALNNSPLAKMESKTEIAVAWAGWLSCVQQFWRSSDMIQTCACLILINKSGFVAESAHKLSAVQCL